MSFWTFFGSFQITLADSLSWSYRNERVKIPVLLTIDPVNKSIDLTYTNQYVQIFEYHIVATIILSILQI